MNFQRELQQKLREEESKAIQRDREVARLKRRIARESRDVEELKSTIEELKKTRREFRQQVEELTDQNRRTSGERDNLRLTLDERETYITGIEETVQRRDVQIALLRMEVENLTLWREKINQQYRTEADIEAAKSQLLQGRNAEQLLENLTRADSRKNNR